MTDHDFADILVRSTIHKHKHNYFEIRRLEHKCDIESYVEGLKNALNDLYHVLMFQDELEEEMIQGEEGSYIRDIFECSIGAVSFSYEKYGQKFGRTIQIDEWDKISFYLQEYFKTVTETEIKLNNEKIVQIEDKFPVHPELYNALKTYISGISWAEFSNIINHFALSPGTPKAIWKEDKVHAYYFAKYLGMSWKKWNLCFKFTDGIKLHGKNKDKNDMESIIVDILKQYPLK